MRYNFISETGDGIGFAIRLTQEGEQVRTWIRSLEAKSIGDNLTPKVGDFEDLLVDAEQKNDIFIFDVSGNGVSADYLRSRGFAVLGGSVLADRLERDRRFGTEVMQRAGINIPETKTFDDFDMAREFIQNNQESRWVYKPSKQLGDLSPSHVSYDSEDLIEMLSNIEHEVDIVEPEFELQEFKKGIAVSTELWFNNGRLIPELTNHTLERKELMNDDIGPSGGCVGNIVWACQGCEICDTTKQLVSFFEREVYHGMLDLNVIVAEDGIYGLEFTPRFGYDASPTLLWELLDEELGKFMADASSGQIRELQLGAGFASGLRVTIPPWPSEKYNADENVPIRGIKADNERTYLYNVKENESGLCSAGAWGILMLFTGLGDSVEEAFVSPSKMAKKVRVKNKQYRTDLVEVFNKDLRRLKSMIEVVV